MAHIREIIAGQTIQAAGALLLLRPRWQTAEALVDFVDARLRPDGYRLVGAFEDSSEAATAVIGFREQHSTAWGRHLYVDDLSTVDAARGRGYGQMLMTWVIAEARRCRCEELHLDSGVGIERAAAHRLYMRHGMRISAHHFSLAIT